MSQKFTFIGTCVTLGDGPGIRQMVDNANQISRKSFLRYVDPQEMKDMEDALGYDRHLPMRRDWCISYYRGRYHHIPVVFFTWSAIEHVFALRT